MKNYLLIILCIFSLSTSTYSQNTEWAIRSGGDYYDQIHQMVKDDAGNLYVLGENSANAQFGNISTSNAGRFLAKLDSSGNYLFVIEFDSIYSHTLCINSSNQILIVGSATGSDVGGTPITYISSGLSVGFAALYDTSGTQLWLTQFDNYGFFGAPTGTYASDFVIAGSLPSNGSIGAFNFTNSEPNTFLAKINSAGVITSAALIGSNNLSSPEIVSDASGNIFVNNRYYYNTTLANGQTLVPNYGTEGYYILKCDPAFNIIWTIHGQGLSDANYFGGVSSMTVLANQNLVVTGSFIDSTQFGNDTIINSSINIHTTFVIAIDPSSNIQWISLSSIDCPVLVQSVDQTGFYLTGTPMNATSFMIDGLPLSATPGYVAMYMVKYSNAGIPLWGKVIDSKHMGGHCCESITSIVKGNSDELYIAGFYYEVAIFDAITLPCYMNGTLCGPYEAFVAKFGNIPLGLESEMSLEPHPIIYPNPTNGTFHIELAKDNSDVCNANIYDLSGRQVMQRQFNTSQTEFDLTKLKDGIYFIQIQNDGKTFNQKIIKITR